MYVFVSLLSALSKYFHCKRDQGTDNLKKLLHFWLPNKAQQSSIFLYPYLIFQEGIKKKNFY
jgi:hypothetical protein